MNNNYNNFSLQSLAERGIIDLDDIHQKIEMNERKKYLEQHTYAVSYSDIDGYWRTYVSDEQSKEGRRKIKRATKEGLEDAIVEHYKGKEKKVYLEDVFHMWINDKLSYGEIERQTAERYGTDFIRFFEGSEISKIQVRYISEEILEDFIRRTICDKQLTAKGWSGLRTILNGIFKLAKKKGYSSISITNFMGDLDLSSKIFRKRIMNTKKNVFIGKEVSQIQEEIRKEPTKAITLGILLSFKTGLRAGELSALKYEDMVGNILIVDKTEVKFRVDGIYQYEVRNFTKGRDGYREVVLTDDAVQIIEQAKALNPNSEYLFVNDKGERIKAWQFSKKLKHICKKLGLCERTIHPARKTYGSILLSSKQVDEKLIISQMGHTDINTTKQYYWYNIKEINEAKEMLERALA